MTALAVDSGGNPNTRSIRLSEMAELMDSSPDDVTPAELRALTASGDLLDLARQMRQMGVESLLFAGPDGRIRAMVTDRQIAYLAMTPTSEPIPEQRRSPSLEPSAGQPPADSSVPVAADRPKPGEAATAVEQVAALTDG